ncbi:SDR family oxidoreductase, partial [Staphylococcus aureus]
MTLLAGKKGLIVGIANRDSIAWACARAMHAAGAEIGATWQNDKARA